MCSFVRFDSPFLATSLKPSPVVETFLALDYISTLVSTDPVLIHLATTRRSVVTVMLKERLSQHGEDVFGNAEKTSWLSHPLTNTQV